MAAQVGCAAGSEFVEVDGRLLGDGMGWRQCGEWNVDGPLALLDKRV